MTFKTCGYRSTPANRLNFLLQSPGSERGRKSDWPKGGSHWLSYFITANLRTKTAAFSGSSQALAACQGYGVQRCAAINAA
jgi:hypothetical protein